MRLTLNMKESIVTYLLEHYFHFRISLFLLKIVYVPIELLNLALQIGDPGCLKHEIL